MRAILYARVSGDDRGSEDRNLNSQLEMGRKYAQEHDYTVVAELAEDDRGASGYAIDLPQLDRARKMARAGEFDVLVTREIDRLSRNLAKQLIVEQELKQAGVEIGYVLGEYPDTPEGRLNKHVKATIAEYEREKIAERTMRARRDKARDGYVITRSRPPYGYRAEDGEKSLVVYEPEARIVRLVFTWYVAGDGTDGPVGTRIIAKRLTDMRVPTWNDVHGLCSKPRSAEGEWAPSTVARLLSNETYIGRWKYGGVEVPIPAITDTPTWESACARRVYNRQMSSRNRKYEYLLAGRIRCGLCGLAVCGTSKVTPKQVYLYYRCSSWRADCALPTVRADYADTATWGWIGQFLTDPAALASGLQAEQEERKGASRPLQDRLAVVDSLLAERQNQLEKLLDLYLDGNFPRDVLTGRQKQLEDGIAALARERVVLVDQLEQESLTEDQVYSIIEYAGEVARGLEVAEQSYEARRRVVDMLDVHVTLTAEGGEKVAYASMLCGSKSFPILPTTTGRTGWRS